jgi:hypothetical protein
MLHTLVRDHQFQISYDITTMRAPLETIIIGILVCASIINLARFFENTMGMPPREAQDVGIWEKRLLGIRGALIRAGYGSGDIGYMPINVFKGSRMTTQEDINWVMTRYVMIPLNVRQNTMDVPFVIFDYTGTAQPEVPTGFVTEFDSVDGLLLLRKVQAQ